jgi:hypothetical protein
MSGRISKGSRTFRLTRGVPILMSLAALGLLLEGLTPEPAGSESDDAWRALIFDLLMVLQMPIMVSCALMGRHSIGQTIPVVSLQILSWIAVAAVAWFLT